MLRILLYISSWANAVEILYLEIVFLIKIWKSKIGKISSAVFPFIVYENFLIFIRFLDTKIQLPKKTIYFICVSFNVLTLEIVLMPQFLSDLVPVVLKMLEIPQGI